MTQKLTHLSQSVDLRIFEKHYPPSTPATTSNFSGWSHFNKKKEKQRNSFKTYQNCEHKK